MKWFKSLFSPKVTHVNSIQSLLPLYDPETSIVGVLLDRDWETKI